MSRDPFDRHHADDRREDWLPREPSTIAEFRVALAAEAAAVDILRAERDAAVARAKTAEAGLDTLATIVGKAIVASSLAPGERLINPPQHAIVMVVDQLRTRAELAEARLAAIVEHIREFSIVAHERYIACDVMKPAHLTLYGAANALDDAASNIRRIATDPKPNRMIIDRAAAVR